MKNPVFKIAITGPESSGKTTLACDLAAELQTLWVPENARIYLAEKGTNYIQNDLLRIAEGQLLAEQRLADKANEYLVCDSDLLVIKVWSLWKYQQCDLAIEQLITDNPYNLHVLCSPDMPWQPDPLRENPDTRWQLFDMYLAELAQSSHQTPFIVVSGTQEARVAQALGCLAAFKGWIK